MNHFDYYNQAWVIYILLGIALLALLDRTFRRFSPLLRLGLHSLLASLAFTPGTVGDSPSYSPLLVASLLNAETQGLQPIIEGLITLALVWLAIFALSYAGFTVWRKKYSTQAKTSEKQVAADDQSDSEQK